MKSKAIVTVLLAVCAQHSYALTGNQLLELMRKDRESLAVVAYVNGTIEGFLVSMGLLRALAETNREPPVIKGFCLPSDSTLKQSIDVTWQWLETNPTERHQMASLTIWRALRKAFPCADGVPPAPSS